MKEKTTYTVFCGDRCIAEGDYDVMMLDVRKWIGENGEAGILFFEDQTGRQVDFDLRAKSTNGTQTRVGPGRPKLGVVSREVSLLPRHWEWLAEQPNGASAALRRLVDQARALPENKMKQARAAAGRFLTAVAGNRDGFEETLRALYAGDSDRVKVLTAAWPDDVRTRALKLAECEI